MEYTEKENKAIEMCNIFVNQNAMISYVACDEKGNLIFPQCDAEAIEIVLKLIEKQQKENIELKDKINLYKIANGKQVESLKKVVNDYNNMIDKIRNKIEELKDYDKNDKLEDLMYERNWTPYQLFQFILKELLGE